MKEVGLGDPLIEFLEKGGLGLDMEESLVLDRLPETK